MVTEVSFHRLAALCYTQYYNFKGKSSVKFQSYERHQYLILMGKLRVSFISYLEKNDENFGLHCTIRIWVFSWHSWSHDICNACNYTSEVAMDIEDVLPFQIHIYMT